MDRALSNRCSLPNSNGFGNRCSSFTIAYETRQSVNGNGRAIHAESNRAIHAASFPVARLRIGTHSGMRMHRIHFRSRESRFARSEFFYARSYGSTVNHAPLTEWLRHVRLILDQGRSGGWGGGCRSNWSASEVGRLPRKQCVPFSSPQKKNSKKPAKYSYPTAPLGSGNLGNESRFAQRLSNAG